MKEEIKEGKNEEKLDWNKVEGVLGGRIPNSYKEFYEKLGSVGIDSGYIYIVNVETDGEDMGLSERCRETIEAYTMLKDFLDCEEQKLDIGFGNEDWFPVGTTTNGDYIFINDEYGVLITDGSFIEREEYECSLLEFVNKYLNNDLKYEVLSEVASKGEHELVVINTKRHEVSGEV